MNSMKLLIVLAASLAISAAASAQGAADALYRNASAPAEARVKDLLGRMTLEEKATMLSGAGWMESAAIPRLGIPAIRMADGPLGVRNWMGSSAVTNAPGAPVITATSFPSGIAMAATWDRALVEREGHALGQETRAHGRDMILGPTVNINRVPVWGRNFEAYGEDPYLSGQLGVAYVRGVQAEGVISSVKHFAANNEEFERHRIDARVSERALREIYLPAFETIVQEAHPWSVMSAYNLLNGMHCSENSDLLNGILKRDFGFQGFVISDWGSTYSTAGTVNAGMDLEMPGGEPARQMILSPNSQLAGSNGTWLEKDKVVAEVKAGHIREAQIDENAGRILRVLFESGRFDNPREGASAIDTPERRAVALAGATEGIVLLKNSGGLLPLDAARLHTIAVIGPNALVARTGGGGSSLVRPVEAVSPLEGIRAAAGNVSVLSAVGVGMEGENPAEDTPEARQKTIREAAQIAARAEVAVVVVGRSSKLEAESFDVRTMDLPAGQDDLIAAVEAANPHTIVVLNTGDPVTVSRWLDGTPALLDMWYGGQEGGRALAAVLFGQANPSGKLPVTFPKRFEDSPAAATYPGKNLEADYAEGIYVGYRYYDTRKVEPQFPFGFGLSYTTFQYQNLKVSAGQGKGPVQVSLTVRNSGSRAGAEVLELYVHDGHAKIDRPDHELKGFARVELAPGASKTVAMMLDRRAFSYWSEKTHGWRLDPGVFEIQAGSSSRDIRLRAPVTLK